MFLITRSLFSTKGFPTLKSNKDTHCANPEIAQSQVLCLLIHGWFCILLGIMSWLLIQTPKSYASPQMKQKLVNLPESPLPSHLSLGRLPTSIVLLASVQADPDVWLCGFGHPKDLKPSVSWLTDIELSALFPIYDIHSVLWSSVQLWQAMTNKIAITWLWFCCDMHNFSLVRLWPTHVMTLLNSTTVPIGSATWLNSATLRLEVRLCLLALLRDIQHFPVDGFSVY
jgi:hypothetical protein